jgi:hypothetical protein
MQLLFMPTDAYIRDCVRFISNNPEKMSVNELANFLKGRFVEYSACIERRLHKMEVLSPPFFSKSNDNPTHRSLQPAPFFQASVAESTSRGGLPSAVRPAVTSRRPDPVRFIPRNEAIQICISAEDDGILPVCMRLFTIGRVAGHVCSIPAVNDSDAKTFARVAQSDASAIKIGDRHVYRHLWRCHSCSLEHKENHLTSLVAVAAQTVHLMRSEQQTAPSSNSGLLLQQSLPSLPPPPNDLPPPQNRDGALPKTSSAKQPQTRPPDAEVPVQDPPPRSADMEEKIHVQTTPVRTNIWGMAGATDPFVAESPATRGFEDYRGIFRGGFPESRAHSVVMSLSPYRQ